jgi:hypothetical protein
MICNCILRLCIDQNEPYYSNNGSDNNVAFESLINRLDLFTYQKDIMNYIKQVVALSYHDEDERIVNYARIDINYNITRNLKTVSSKGQFIHSGNNMYDSFISLIIPEKSFSLRCKS